MLHIKENHKVKITKLVYLVSFTDGKNKKKNSQFHDQKPYIN